MCSRLESEANNTVKQHNMINHGDCIIIGVSGGADSVSLLLYLSNLRETMNLKLIAVHINHGIRGDEALRDENFVIEICRKLDIQCKVFHRDILSIAKTNKISEELAGRNERYKIFKDVLIKYKADKIAVAHNQNDSVETVLIKLTRGCSLNGLRGISPVNGNIIRPLINVSRKDIELYLMENDFSYVIDSSNNENVYTRNIVRNCIIPYFEKINPGFINTVCSNSVNIACDDDFVESYAKAYYDKCVQVADDMVTVDLSACDNQHLAIKKRILLYAYSIIKGDKADIEQKHINILVNASGTGKKYDIGNNIVAEIRYGKIVFCKKSDVTYNDYCVIISDFNNMTYNISGFCINFDIIDNNSSVKRNNNSVYVNYDKIINKKILVRNRRNGDKFIPSGMNGFKKIKDYFIDIKLEKHLRNITPVLCADDEIVSILGYRVDNRFTINNKTNKILKITINGGTDENK